MLLQLFWTYFNPSKLWKKAMSTAAGAGSGKKILGAGAAPKQAGSETLWDLRRKHFVQRVESGRISKTQRRPNKKNNYRYVTHWHRRRIYTESKANCRRFGLGGKIESALGFLSVKCSIVYIAVVQFPFTFVGVTFYADFYIKFLIQMRFNCHKKCLETAENLRTWTADTTKHA